MLNNLKILPIMEENVDSYSNFIKKEDSIECLAIEKDEEKVCRICFDQEGGNIISPCKCRGNSKYVHDECLRSWIKVKFESIENAKCEVCMQLYKVTVKKSWKCQKNLNLKENYSLFAKILVLFLIMFTVSAILFAIMIGIMFLENFSDNSIVSAGVCSIPLIIAITFLIRYFIKLCVFRKVEISFDAPSDKKIEKNPIASKDKIVLNFIKQRIFLKIQNLIYY
ncbi:hypothetical protein SteCoe_16911 [Stentor coeruleus]|uniref:RING-CH-type domain-containing protein n=1 Tax=Stentor coeruleus TaxID=5963 RepID=A0A1R2C096_9CILI|nr:hypothetical protein SteCoe_16911 [Stentor coeruleus]